MTRRVRTSHEPAKGDRMPEWLRTSDLAFLSQERVSAPMHVATLEVFESPPDGFDYHSLVALIGDRIAFVPRYRQRVQSVPARLGNPVWVDDDDFDLTYHVRQSALPRPGTMEQLRELVARIVSRPLDRSRPLWETYLVEGLEHHRFAVLSKSHQALVDGVSTLDLGQLILDVSPEPPQTVPDEWRPQPAPSPAALMLDAVGEAVRRPRHVVETIRGGVGEVRHEVGRLGRLVTSAASAVAPGRLAGDGPLVTSLSQQRRFIPVETDFEDYRAVRAMHGGTVNDVVLATIAGALRMWLMTRAESVGSGARMKALVPLSVLDEDGEPTSLGSQVTAHLLNLPIGETSPVMRLHQVSYALKAHKETGRAVSASRLARISGFAPSTFHALGARVAMSYPKGDFNLVITNVPGPQFPLYAFGARMLASYPVLPLREGHALSVGVTSYDGKVFYGIDADYDALPDAEVIGQCIVDAVEELVETTTTSRTRAPRGRSRPAGKARADPSRKKDD
jgi:diacylglycerol O-acyltransferase / wax synthase